MAWKDGRFKASTLENSIKRVLEEKLGSGHADDLMYNPGLNFPCKSIVCAVEARHMNKTPTNFRDWLPTKDANYNCKIWEAARATSAAPHLFKRVTIGEPLRQQHFVDGALGCNNPIRHVLSEALREFMGSQEVGCILSIGTGMRLTAGFQPLKGYQRVLPKDLVQAIARMVTDCDEVADQMTEQFRNYGRMYHRFNAGYELGAIGLNECSRLGEVEAHTRAYLRQKNSVSASVIPSTDNLSALKLPPNSLDRPVSFPNHPRDEFSFVRRTEMSQIDKHFKKFRDAQRPSRLVLHAVEVLACSLDSYGPEWPILRGPSRQHHLLRPHVEGCYNNCEKWLPEQDVKVSDQIWTRASSALMLANFFASDNQYNLAEELQRRYIALMRCNSPEKRSALRQLSKTMFLKDQLSEARDIQEAILKQSDFIVDDIEGALLLVDLALTYRGQAYEAELGKMSDQASDLLDMSFEMRVRGLETFRSLKGAESKEAASASAHLATIEYHKGNLHSARELEEAAVAILTKTNGERDLRTLEAKQELAVTLAKLGETKTAIMMHQEVWDGRSQVLGPEHPKNLRCEIMLARALRLDGQLTKAHERNENALAKMSVLRGRDHAETIQAGGSFWRCLIAEGRIEEADQLRDEYGIALTAIEEDMRAQAINDQASSNLIKT
ncbi:hypothetical protein M406DRAFT_76171 [Cryphonectria parasitica EP155]|uniref:PNPLA domain-containing protein n=1 Tax=Cryphonectria parasitica (strain ATCC 38755 / EP155) TaxID=660469 RepID=A0A9P4Y4R9_CRYP1|nr:uncharacterized protein M406DRAFT_76171 [Cryphonectria parasitica EP155]KAF3766651.1 hypothetical protein M406DRAFT_76171 [Cryphonectria parasitica EP155]